MSLREHLAELRTRLMWAGLAILLASVIGWFLFPPLVQALQRPLNEVAAKNHIQAQLNYSDIMQAFNLHLRIASYLGLVLASPVWLYQLWAFVVPGLTRREKRSALGFTAAGVPLFLAGIYVGWLVVPNAVTFFTSFAEPGTSVLPAADEYFDFVTRVLLVFGLAFLLPLVLVALNLAGVLSAATMARAWRIAVFSIFLFAAVAAPSADAGSMLALALPMVGLYVAAVGVATLVDRRRARNDPFAGLDADQASTLDGVGPVGASLPLDRLDPGESGALHLDGDTPTTTVAAAAYDDVS